MPDLADITPLAILAMVIILTDRWIVRFYREFKEQNERKELSDQQMMLIMMQCSESLLTIKESLSPSTLPESRD
ncbi:MAG: hypothetical protein KAS19_09110 [Anaerolineales bacterium]|nr:hypothetical protein [Anaerolineales bacterium]